MTVAMASVFSGRSIVVALLLAVSLAQPALAQSVSGQAASAQPAKTQADSNSSQALTKKTQRGPVTATLTLSASAIPIGDEIEITLEVSAADRVELALPQFGQSLERFPIVDFIPSSRVTSDGTTISTQKYRLRPEHSGRHRIPSLMVEFVDRRDGKRPAPDNEDAYELLTEPMSFEVTSVVPDVTAGVLHPPLGELSEPPISEKAKPISIALVVLVIVAGSIALYVWMRRSRPVITISAYARARRRLDALRGRGEPQAEEMDQFFVELSAVVRSYVEAQFGLHAPELTTEEFLDLAVASPDLNAAHQGFLRDFLSSADSVKFAGHVPSGATATETLDAVTRFIDDTEAAESLSTQTPEAPHG
jgi:hypothetical protein